MKTRKEGCVSKLVLGFFTAASLLLCNATAAFAGESELVLPELKSVKFLSNTIDGWSLLFWGLLICVFGMVFGAVQFSQIKKLKVAQVNARYIRAYL